MVGQFFVFITWAKQLYHGAVPCITLIEILWSDLTLKATKFPDLPHCKHSSATSEYSGLFISSTRVPVEQ